MISLARIWLHHQAACRGWEEIHEHLEKQIGEASIPQVQELDDPNSPNVNPNDGDVAGTTLVDSQPDQCKSSGDQDDDDDDKFTIVRYKHLTIRIEGKITVGNNLISLSIYECSWFSLIGPSTIRNVLMFHHSPTKRKFFHFGLPSTNRPIDFRPITGLGTPRTVHIVEDEEKERIYSGVSKSYLKISGRPGTFTVKVAPRRRRRIGRLSAFQIESFNRPSVIRLNKNTRFALKFDEEREIVVVDRLPRDNIPSSFKFQLRSLPKYHLKTVYEH